MKDSYSTTINIVADEDEVITAEPATGICSITLEKWEDVSKILEILLSNGYLAKVTKDEKYYTILYDWADSEWSDNRLMWVKLI